jgi:hypothetical protein
MQSSVNINIPSDWTSYVTQTNLGLEVVPAVLYDTLTLPAAGGTTELRFFQQINVPLDISNMKTSGMLSNPEAFLIQTIAVFFKGLPQSTTAAAAGATQTGQFEDVVTVTNTGIAELTIGNKKYGPWPLWRLPAASFTKGLMSASGTTVINYAQVDGPMYPLFPNLMLSPLQPFVLSVRWPSSATGSPVISVNTPLEILFDGQLARSIQ